jgi:hypothetical protein
VNHRRRHSHAQAYQPERNDITRQCRRYVRPAGPDLPGQGSGFRWPYLRRSPRDDGYSTRRGCQREIRHARQGIVAFCSFCMNVSVVSSRLRMIQNAIPSIDADQKRQGGTPALFSVSIEEVEGAFVPLVIRLTGVPPSPKESIGSCFFSADDEARPQNRSRNSVRCELKSVVAVEVRVHLTALLEAHRWPH